MKNDKNKNVKLSLIVVVVTGMFTVAVLIVVLFLSLFGKNEFLQVYGGVINESLSAQYSFFCIIPKNVSLEQYIQTFWSNSDFWYYFWNTVRISVSIIIGTTVVSCLGGYAFARYNFFAKKVWLYVIIIMMMIPYQVLLAPQFRVIYDMNLLNHEEAIIFPNIFTPFGVFLIYQYAIQLSEEQFEAARMDGASEMKIFWSIGLPQMKNGIMSLILLVLIDTYNLIEQPIVFLAEEFRYPLSVAIEQLENSNGGLSFAACIVFIIPLVLIFLLGKEWLIQGIGHSVVD